MGSERFGEEVVVLGSFEGVGKGGHADLDGFGVESFYEKNEEGGRRK